MFADKMLNPIHIITDPRIYTGRSGTSATNTIRYNTVLNKWDVVVIATVVIVSRCCRP